MHPSITAASYDRLAQWYDRTVAATYGLAQLQTALKFVKERKGPALDVGCGSTGRFIEELLQKGFLPEGLDASAEMLALARTRHPEVTFHHADICEWTPPRTYQFVSAWDSTFHLPLDQQEPVLRKLCDALAPGGVLFFTCGGTDTPGEITGVMEGEEMGYSTLGVDAFLQVLREQGCLCRHVEYDQYPEQHVYIVAQKS